MYVGGGAAPGYGGQSYGGQAGKFILLIVTMTTRSNFNAGNEPQTCHLHLTQATAKATEEGEHPTRHHRGEPMDNNLVIVRVWGPMKILGRRVLRCVETIILNCDCAALAVLIPMKTGLLFHRAPYSFFTLHISSISQQHLQRPTTAKKEEKNPWPSKPSTKT